MPPTVADTPWGFTGTVGPAPYHLGFNTWGSKDGGPRPLNAAGVPIRQASDHGTHEALYLSDPDGNDLEPAWDRPVAEWPRDAEGHVAMSFGDVDLDDLLTALP
jgi:catechol 2,3-dioxygenase